MINTQAFGDELKDLGFNFYSGVPCSFLKHLINYAINECDYTMAANEGDAVAIASGAYLGGKKSVVLMQNSGLTNATSPLTSLNYSFKLPILGFVSLRGEEGLNDEPQHELMGQITVEMLSLMQVKWEYLADNMEEASKQLVRANNDIENNETFFFVVKKGTFESVKLQDQKLTTSEKGVFSPQKIEDSFPTRTAALQTINSLKDDNTIFLATTGKTGRELFEVEDNPNNLYMVGSMGCISSLGLGLALARPDKRVVVIDGDGSLLMRMGNMPTIAYYQPSNLIHVLLDNNTHDSTGGQATISHNIDFTSLAQSAGYVNSVYAHNIEEFESHLANWNKTPQMTFAYLKTAKGSPEKLGRPTIKPHEVKTRLMNFINS